MHCTICACVHNVTVHLKWLSSIRVCACMARRINLLLQQFENRAFFIAALNCYTNLFHSLPHSLDTKSPRDNANPVQTKRRISGARSAKKGGK